MLQRFVNKFKFYRRFLSNYLSRADVFYVGDGASWVLDDIGSSIQNTIKGLRFKQTTFLDGIRNSIVHYSSSGFVSEKKGYRLPHPSNKVVVTWFHVVDGDKRLGLYPELIEKVDKWHTASTQQRNKLIALGIPEDRIAVVAIGLDIDKYPRTSDKIQSERRDELGISKEKIIIGSFQKDGNGWDEGFEPKLIKGPDLFCDVVEALSQYYDIEVLLTGPSRGYVKKRLECAGITYKHDFLDDPQDVSKYYQACDLYIMASREEGGPRSITECMAVGVPIVATRTGMAEDVIIDGENGMLAQINNIIELVEKAQLIINDNNLSKSIVNSGFETVERYDYSVLAEEYKLQIYQQLK